MLNIRHKIRQFRFHFIKNKIDFNGGGEICDL